MIGAWPGEARRHAEPLDTPGRASTSADPELQDDAVAQWYLSALRILGSSASESVHALDTPKPTPPGEPQLSTLSREAGSLAYSDPSSSDLDRISPLTPATAPPIMRERRPPSWFDDGFSFPHDPYNPDATYDPDPPRPLSRFSDSSSDTELQEAIARSLQPELNGKGKGREQPRRLSRIFHSASNSFSSAVESSSSAASPSTPRKLMQRFTSRFTGKAGSSSSAAAAESSERARQQRAQEDRDRQLAMMLQNMDSEGIDYDDHVRPEVVESWMHEEAVSSPVEQDTELLGLSEFDCGICLETCPVDVVCITEGCRHKICRDCMQGHIKASLEEKRYPIPCAICATDRSNRDPSGARRSTVVAFPLNVDAVISQLDVELAGLDDKLFAVWTELQLAEVSMEMKCTK